MFFYRILRPQARRDCFLWALVFLILPTTGYSAWETLEIPVTTREFVYDLQFISPTEGWALMGTGFKGYRILHTTNGGEDWTQVGNWNTEIGIGDYGHFQFVSPTEAWLVPWDIAEQDLLLHTENGGVTIEEASSPFSGGVFDAVYAVHFLDSQTGWLAGTTLHATGSVAKTIDGGMTWEVKPTPRLFPIHDFFFLNQDYGWAAGSGPDSSGLIQRTEDGGETWTIARVEGLTSPIAIRFADELHGWSVGRGGLIVYSNNGGRRWYRQESGTDRDLFDVEVFSDHDAIAVGDMNFTGGVVLSTNNGGATRKREHLPKDVSVRCIASFGNTVWVGGGPDDFNNPTVTYLFRRTFTAEEFPAIVVKDLPGGTLGVEYEYGFTAVGGNASIHLGVCGRWTARTVLGKRYRTTRGNSLGGRGS
ncbi:MAG: hypothetical protein KC964_23410 [Candidatus Omnitrophica bacterium]|nr:hypothetical protein [Candidatus Omnitrophota bacterium]